MAKAAIASGGVDQRRILYGRTSWPGVNLISYITQGEALAARMARHLLEVNCKSIGSDAIIESDNSVLLLSIFALKESVTYVTYPMECAMVIEDVRLFSAFLVQAQPRP